MLVLVLVLVPILVILLSWKAAACRHEMRITGVRLGVAAAVQCGEHGLLDWRKFLHLRRIQRWSGKKCTPSKMKVKNSRRELGKRIDTKYDEQGKLE